MGNRRVRGLATAIAIVLLSLAATQAATHAARAEQILVFAAASSSLPITEIARAYEGKTGHRVRISLAASSALARQIDHGAPANIFVSANAQWMDWLEARGKIIKTGKTNLAGNRLVLVAPAGSAAAMNVFSAPSVIGILNGARLAVADPAHVPAGIYARQALRGLGAWRQISGHLAPSVNVRAALALVERGALPLGIVYASDAHDNRAVDILFRFPGASHGPIRYVAAAVAGQGDGQAGGAAAGFLSALTARGAKQVFKKYGFEAD
jgi:molybdate transport system substrate-binding protein